MNKKNLPLPVKILRRGFITVFNIMELPFYYLFGLFPRNKNLWIFCSWFGQRYSDNSRMFFEYVNKNHPEIKTVWLSKNKDIVKKLRAEGRNAFSSYSIAGLFCSLRASKIFSTTGGEMSLFFCRNAEHYALWHGMPLKKILNDDTNSGGESANSAFRRKTSLILRKLFPWKIFLEQKKLSELSLYTLL